MTKFDLIDLSRHQVDDAVFVRLKLNRPQARNALNNQMAAELTAACAELSASEDVALVVVEAEGSVFCAGADVKERGGLDDDQIRARRLRGFRAYNAIENLPMPVFAVVDGPCVGSGCEIALSCDFVLASGRASFRTPEARWGTVGATQRLSRAIGLRRAKEMMFSGAVIDAQTAERWGLVNRLLNSDGFAAEVESFVVDVLQAPPAALRMAKRAMSRAYDDSRHGALAHEIFAIEDNLDAGEWKKGMQKALSKPEL